MTDFRALCVELTDALDRLNCSFNVPNQSGLVERASAALAEPEPEDPTDADLHAMAFSYSQPCYEFEYIPFARSVLARWGTCGFGRHIRFTTSRLMTDPMDNLRQASADVSGVEVLSPSAQAVLQAFDYARDGEYIDGEWVVNERAMLAAALRAAMDQAIPEEPLHGGDQRWMYERDARQSCRKRLLVIAAELEANS